MKIALLGGSFNPVHKGHLALAESAVKLAGYDYVVFVPAYQSPFKQRCVEITSENSGRETDVSNAKKAVLNQMFTDNERVEMLRLGIKPYPWAKLELCEIERGGVSYTIDTVRFLTQKYRTEGLILADGTRGFLEGRLGLVIGADLIDGFPRWKEADALAQETDIILARRPDAVTASSGTDAGNARFPYPHISIMNELYDISSTEVRERIVRHDELSALIPDEICRYIKQRGVYDS